VGAGIAWVRDRRVKRDRGERDRGVKHRAAYSAMLGKRC